MPQQPATDAGHRDVGGSTPVPAVAAIDDATGFSLPGGIVASNENPMVCQHCEFATSTATWPRSLISRASDQTERFSCVPTTSSHGDHPPSPPHRKTPFGSCWLSSGAGWPEEVAPPATLT